MTIAKVFKNGRSQAIRLPKEFRVDTDEVYLKRTSEGFLVIPRDPWEVFFEGVKELAEDFFRDGREQPELEQRGLANMTYLLDTATIVFMIRGLKPNVRPRQRRTLALNLVQQCQRVQHEKHSIGISAITVSELEFGARNSADYEAVISAVRKILLPFDCYAYDSVECPLAYGRIRSSLAKSGQVIGAMDMLIAAHALSLQATLVTNNEAHFRRVPGLLVENWA